MAEQLTLDLPYRSAMGREDFFVTEANAAAVAGIDTWCDWPLAKMVLVGPKGSGKTHLAHVFARQTGAVIVSAAAIGEADILPLSEAPAVVVEDADRAAGQKDREEHLFHLHNALAARAAPLLFTGRTPPARWPIGLPDLLSRLQQAGHLTLLEPDDTLMAAVMMKLSQDRGLGLPARVLRYALPRLDRSLEAVGAFVAALDAETLTRGEKPGVRHAREILARMSG